MAFNMKKPSIIKGSTAHKKALKQLRVRTTGYRNLPDGRSKSSAFQQNEGPVDPNQMTVEDQIRMADKQYEDIGGAVHVSGDYYDPTSFATDYIVIGRDDETGNVLDPRDFHMHVKSGRMLAAIRAKHGEGSEEEERFERAFMSGGQLSSDGTLTREYYDPKKIKGYVRQYNDWRASQHAMNQYEPGSGDEYTFQQYQQEIADHEQKRRAEQYAEKNPITFTKRVNPMNMSDRELAIELVASGKYKTVDEAMSNIQNNSPARDYKKGYYN